jgi:hypothetical protein
VSERGKEQRRTGRGGGNVKWGERERGLFIEYDSASLCTI